MNNANNILSILLETIRDTKEFISSEAPDVARQIISYELMSNYICLIIGIALMLTYVFTFWKTKDPSFDDSDRSAMRCFGLIPVIFGFIMATNVSLNIYKIKACPKLFLTEYVSHMITSNTK